MEERPLSVVGPWGDDRPYCAWCGRDKLGEGERWHYTADMRMACSLCVKEAKLKIL